MWKISFNDDTDIFPCSLIHHRAISIFLSCMPKSLRLNEVALNHYFLKQIALSLAKNQSDFRKQWFIQKRLQNLLKENCSHQITAPWISHCRSKKIIMQFIGITWRIIGYFYLNVRPYLDDFLSYKQSYCL